MSARFPLAAAVPYRSPGVLGLLLAAGLPLPSAAQMVETAFTYQGELTVAGVPANAPHDFEFRLFNAESFGEPIGPTVGVDEVPVQGGLFNVLLDFGPGQFAGDAQWLEIRVRAAGEGAFQVLSPRTPVTPAPYAIAALHALDGSVTGASIVDGSIQGSHLEPGAVGAAQVDSSEVQLRVAGSCPAGQFMRSVDVTGTVNCSAEAPALGWSLGGNSGTDAALHFVGTTDLQPFVLRAGNARGLRIEPSSVLTGGLPLTANVIAGSRANAAVAGVRGAVVGGGGAAGSDPDAGGGPNEVSDHFGTVSGGALNLAGNNAGTLNDSAYATVGGGRANRSEGFGSVVGGGEGNQALGRLSAVAGGHGNSVGGQYAFVGGGSLNGAVQNAAVLGGFLNGALGRSTAVLGGSGNFAFAEFGVVLGGSSNCAGAARSLAAGSGAVIRYGTNAGDTGDVCAGAGPIGVLGDIGTFVWADSQPGNFISTGANQFLLRAGGGVAINTNDPAGHGLRVNGTVRVDQLRTEAVSTSGARTVVVGLDGQLGTNADVAPRILYARVNSNCTFAHGSSGLTVSEVETGVCRISYPAFSAQPVVTATPQVAATRAALVQSSSSTQAVIRMFDTSTSATLAWGFNVHIIGPP